MSENLGDRDPDEELDEFDRIEGSEEDSISGSVRRDFPDFPDRYNATIDKVVDMIADYRAQELVQDGLKRLFKWAERDGFELNSVEEIMPFLEKRKAHADEVNKATVGSGQKGVLEDTAIYIATVINILEGCQSSPEEDPPIPLQTQLEVIYADHKVSWSQFMNNQFQEAIIELEKMRLLICNEDPEKRFFAQAGDIIIPMWERFTKIIKHEICKAIIPPEAGKDNMKIKFGTDMSLADLREDDISILPGPYDGEDEPEGL